MTPLKPLFLFCTLVIALAISTCDNPSSDKSSNPLDGKWTWLQTVGGFAYQKFLPPPAVVLEFNEDGSYTFYRNDTIIYKKHYSLSREKLYAADSQNIIDLSTVVSDTLVDYRYLPAEGKKYYEMASDTLIIGDLGNDGFTYLFLKKK